MSRTNRNLEGMHRCAFRYPKTKNERTQLDTILHDNELMELPVSKVNHMKARGHNLPSAWDDKIVSGYYQQDYKLN
jgi:hypothetical protein